MKHAFVGFDYFCRSCGTSLLTHRFIIIVIVVVQWSNTAAPIKKLVMAICG